MIEFTFNETGFDAKWKQGLEPGPMRGKWTGALNNISTISENKDSNTVFNFFIDRGELENQIKALLSESTANQKLFCNDLIYFVKENQEYLWLLPAYIQILENLQNLIDDGELEGSISGFLNKSQLVGELSTEIFSNKSYYYSIRRSNNEFARSADEDGKGLLDLLLQDIGISKEEILKSYESEWQSDEQINFVRFINLLRTVLFATIVRAYYAEKFSNEQLAYLIMSPYDDFGESIDSEIDDFGSSVGEAIHDVLFCLGIDVHNEEFDELWGNYEKNYKKMAESISDRETYDFPLIEIYK